MIPNESYPCIIPLFDCRQKLWLASSQRNMASVIRSLLWCQVVWLYKSADRKEVNAMLWERWWESYNIARSCGGLRSWEWLLAAISRKEVSMCNNTWPWLRVDLVGFGKGVNDTLPLDTAFFAALITTVFLFSYFSHWHHWFWSGVNILFGHHCLFHSVVPAPFKKPIKLRKSFYPIIPLTNLFD